MSTASHLRTPGLVASWMLLAGVAGTGCSLTEKEFDTGRSVESQLSGDGLGAGDGDEDDLGDRPGDDGTDPAGADGSGGDGADGEDGSGSGSGSGDGSDGGEGEGEGSGSGGSSGGDSGSGSGSDGSSSVDCSSGAVSPAGNIDSCVSDIISCGDSVLATTVGGNSVMNSDDYVSWFCTPSPDGQYEGSERTYHITVPAGEKATFVLDSPCEDLDIFVLRWELWESNESCPDYVNSVIECEADDGRAGGTVEVFADPGRDTNYLVMIDGPDAEQAAFALDVTCE